MKLKLPLPNLHHYRLPCDGKRKITGVVRALGPAPKQGFTTVKILECSNKDAVGLVIDVINGALIND